MLCCPVIYLTIEALFQNIPSLPFLPWSPLFVCYHHSTLGHFPQTPLLNESIQSPVLLQQNTLAVIMAFLLPLTSGKHSVEHRKCSVHPPPDQGGTQITQCANLLSDSLQAALHPHMHREIVRVSYIHFFSHSHHPFSYEFDFWCNCRVS